MPLTRTVDEVKGTLPNFISNLSDNNSLPLFEQAEIKYLVPFTGMDLYENIKAKYIGGTLTADDTALLLKMRLVAVSYAYHDSLPSMHLSMTDSGLVQFGPADSKPLPKWAFEKLQNNLANIAAGGLEVLLQFLLFKKPAAWLNSDAYQDIKGLLITTGTDFSRQFPLLNPLATFFFIRPVIKDAQDMFITQGIGEELLAYLLQSTSVNVNIKNAMAALKKALAFYSIYQCCGQFEVRFSKEGFTVLSGSASVNSSEDLSSKAADAGAMQRKEKATEANAQDWLRRACVPLISHYKEAGADAAYKTAFEKSPLYTRLNSGPIDTGNDRRKGVWRLPGC